MADNWIIRHQPFCGACGITFSAVETLQQHVNGGGGPCAVSFKTIGCQYCLLFFGTSADRDNHLTVCKCAPQSSLTKSVSSPDLTMGGSSPSSVLEASFPESFEKSRARAVAVACEMVGGGLDGTVDVAARVCIVDDHESVLLHTFVRPSLPVTTYRDSHVRPEELEQGAHFKFVRRQVLSILNSSDASTADPLPISSKRPLLLGHDLQQHLECLMIDYPEHLRRDTALYPPLLSGTGKANSLDDLAQAHLRCEIERSKEGQRDLKKEALAVLRLYRLFCSSPPGHKHETLYEGKAPKSKGTEPVDNSLCQSSDALVGPGSGVSGTQVLLSLAEGGDAAPPPCWCLDECPADSTTFCLS